MILILVLILTIGFASVSTTLVMNGLIGISNKKEDFKVIFTEAILDGVKSNYLIDETNKETINYETRRLTALNETTTLEYEVTNTSRLYDAEVSVTCNIVDDRDNVITNDYISINYEPNNMIVSSGETKTGSITTKLIKASTEDQSISMKCELNASATERESLGVEYIPTVTFEEGYVLTDTNKNGIADIGEEITVGTESFYVISNTNTELNALAKYNLKVGNIYSSDGNTLERTILNTEEGYGIQNVQMRGNVQEEKRYGTLKFSNFNGWPYENNDTINIKQYDGPVKEALYGENGYEKYIQNIISTASVRLITKGDIETLINDGNVLSSGFIKTKADDKGYSWIYSTSYWTQSASSSVDFRLWYVGSIGDFYGYHFGSVSLFGVRPVVTIPIS